MKEKQVNATWYTPEERLPESGAIVLATVNAHTVSLTWINSFMLVEYDYDDKMWYPSDVSSAGSYADLVNSLEIIAWCDIEPY